MKEFDEWLQAEADGYKTCKDVAENAFKSGMLAAAQIAEDSASHNMSDICRSQNIADLIREAAK